MSDKRDITVADVIKSDEFKEIAKEHLSAIRQNIKDTEAKCGRGERLKSTPAVRLNKLGLLTPDNFISTYACILAKQHIDLPSTLRKAVKDEGDMYFNLAYVKLVKNCKQDE